jgi:hypothetical protein
VRAINLIFIIDSYDEKELSRLDYYHAFIKSLSKQFSLLIDYCSLSTCKGVAKRTIHW